jgi:hypothetical protein
MYIYNFFEEIDTLANAVRETARNTIITKALAEAKRAHPMTIRALEAEIEACREELAQLRRLKDSTPLRLAVAINSNGGAC